MTNRALLYPIWGTVAMSDETIVRGNSEDEEIVRYSGNMILSPILRLDDGRDYIVATIPGKEKLYGWPIRIHDLDGEHSLKIVDNQEEFREIVGLADSFIRYWLTTPEAHSWRDAAMEDKDGGSGNTPG